MKRRLWFRKAAVQGFTPAQINLGLAAGRTLPQDMILGYAWLQKAADQGDRIAREKRDIIGKQLSTYEIEKAKRMSNSLY